MFTMVGRKHFFIPIPVPKIWVPVSKIQKVIPAHPAWFIVPAAWRCLRGVGGRKHLQDYAKMIGNLCMLILTCDCYGDTLDIQQITPDF